MILYADRMTGSMERAIRETDRRREKQHAYNVEHGITPATIKRDIHDIVADTASRDSVLVEIDADGANNLVGHNLRAYIDDLEKKMRAAAADLEFEEAGRLRDEIRSLEATELDCRISNMSLRQKAAQPRDSQAHAKCVMARRSANSGNRT